MNLALLSFFLLSQLSGLVVTKKNESVYGVTVTAKTADGNKQAVTNDDGEFTLDVPNGPVTLRFEGKNIRPQELSLSDTQTGPLRIEVEFVVPQIHESIVIVASGMEPQVETYSDEVYKKSLFSRDDQLLETLNGGINAGQHEGGGKSLEIRRFGFNLDHGGVNGGLKILVDDVQQNQGTQGHGQGYLGALKTLTPELVQEVTILNGPFSAEYGDFSGLGVVHIRLKEELPDQGTMRLQAGRFGSYRTFFAYSPNLKKANAFLAYEGSRTDGPFINPSRYKRDNITGNYTRNLDVNQTLGFKLNMGRNDFYSSGQLPLDLVADGRLSRFGFVDPSDGGRVRMGTAALYYRRNLNAGDSFKVDGFVGRSLFDLYSNFTLFLNDPIHGDGIQQHDSRLQEGVTTQYLHPYSVGKSQALLTAGTNFHDNQINVGLFPSEARNPLGVTTQAFAHVTNVAGYAQNSVDLLRGRLHMEGGLRWDYFRFKIGESEGAARFQPKVGLSFHPSKAVPVGLTFNYGRGINTQDARGIVQNPGATRIATTDFYEAGTTYEAGRVSLSADLFLIDRSNEQVYIPDDGSFELKDPSRSYGFEAKTSIRFTRHLSFNAGITQVSNSFYRGTSPRVYVDSAPHTVANGAITLSGWKGIYSSLRYRHIGNYRLDGLDPSIRATGLDVLDFALSRPIRKWVELNLDIDNVANKRFFETQNYFESRVFPTSAAVSRIHGTPGYPIGITAGLTFHIGGK